MSGVSPLPDRYGPQRQRKRVDCLLTAWNDGIQTSLRCSETVLLAGENSTEKFRHNMSNRTDTAVNERTVASAGRGAMSLVSSPNQFRFRLPQASRLRGSPRVCMSCTLTVTHVLPGIRYRFDRFSCAALEGSLYEIAAHQRLRIYSDQRRYSQRRVAHPDGRLFALHSPWYRQPTRPLPRRTAFEVLRSCPRRLALTVPPKSWRGESVGI